MLYRLLKPGILVYLLVIILSCPSFALTDQNGDGIIFNIGPPPGRVITPHGVRCTGYPFRDLMENSSEWSTTRDTFDYLGYASWILNDNFTNAELASYFSLMNDWDLKFVLGVMALKDLSYARSGEQCYNTEKARWIRFNSLGLTISALGIDEPLIAAINANLGETELPQLSNVEYAARETADFIELSRSDIIIGNKPISLTLAYPRGETPEVCKAQIFEYLDLLQDDCENRGIHGISDLAIDFNWCGYSSSSYWLGLIEIENHCDSIGLPFAMTFWPARSYQPNSPDRDFYDDIRYEGDLYFNTYGGSPDIVGVTAWDYTPRVMVPDTSPPANEYPFTWAVLAFYDEFIDTTDGDLSSSQTRVSATITSLSPNPSRSSVSIHFNSLEDSADTHLEIFDVTGRMVSNIEVGPVAAGDNLFSWDGCSNGSPVSTGVYFVRVMVGNQASATSRLMIVSE